GYTGMAERETPNGPVTVLAGREGLEATLDSVLTGMYGWRKTEIDSKRRELVAYRDQDFTARPGHHVYLTIDSGVQHIVESELAEVMMRHNPVSASAIVVRPRTGEILAMANLPTFNPNEMESSTPESRRNRIVTDQSEPGSTFKIVVVSAALTEGLISLQDHIHCENGRFVFAGIPLKDDHAYGLITVEDIIAKSSNIGAAKIGIRMGPERLYQYVRNFGFGSRTGILLPGEVAGTVHQVPKWSKISISRIPMGHEIATTPLQMVMAMAAIANKGVLMKPMIVDRVVDEDGSVIMQHMPQPVRQVVSEPAARMMVQALKSATSTNGTARKAQLDCYTVAGKTGTAQKPINGQYIKGKYFSSYIGFFPADNPELCISVVLDEPKKGYYGGETASPVFQKIAERSANYLAIPPERIPATNIAALRN
ncbi:MAG: penicillin-binding protein 2, partial [Verrucomicrobiota bacterium]|nr:penicillin-binding protein 2 [Verrucomicrobiota bacterium]